MADDLSEEERKFFNYESYADVWHEVQVDGKLWTVTEWSVGSQTQWTTNGITEFEGSLEFDLIYKPTDN